jgi:hypothetical protein
MRKILGTQLVYHKGHLHDISEIRKGYQPHGGYDIKLSLITRMQCSDIANLWHAETVPGLLAKCAVLQPTKSYSSRKMFFQRNILITVTKLLQVMKCLLI